MSSSYAGIELKHPREGSAFCFFLREGMLCQIKGDSDGLAGDGEGIERREAETRDAE